MFKEGGHSNGFDENLGLRKSVLLPKRPPQVTEEMRSSSSSLAWEMMEAEMTDDPLPSDIQERINSDEVLNGSAQYLDVFKLGSSEEERLSADLAKWGGSVRVFVHPYYLFNHHYIQEYEKTQRRVDEILSQILSKESDKRPPVLFVESYDEVDKLYQHIKTFNKDDVYIAPTFSESSQPYPDEEAKYSLREKSFQNGNWMRLINILKGVGVEKIIIGGLNFDRRGRNDRENGYGSCVGYAINNFKPHFDVRLSNATNITRNRLSDREDI